jgi:hypothetical protein
MAPTFLNFTRMSKLFPTLLLIASTAFGQAAPKSSSDAIRLAADGTTSTLVVEPTAWPGVTRAAHDLAEDVHSVTGLSPAVTQTVPHAGDIVLIATVGRSALLDRLAAQHKIDLTPLHNQWEATLAQTVKHPFPGIRSALIIAGSDKRGAIYGAYDVSRQIGVSPWYWWADVPIPHKDALYLPAGRVFTPSPVVKYRGIFLNDEAPALSGMVHEKFGTFNSQFYARVFTLLLRLRANLLWPAMWANAFNEDDPANPKLADEYGIVMSTSHHEPMMRAQQEWKRHGTGPWDYTTNSKELQDFWRDGVRRNKNYEELTTIGMRGDGDMAMSASTNTALLERIVKDQRQILTEEVNPDITKIPQVWALYKEVQGYYEAGMRVPDDVTLLWCDDNWGNIRRLPTAEERKRAGGAGIYYHFDYVGDPRNYKWINTNTLTKTWEQMHLAWQYGATRMWIVNVGDLKPMELPIDFFLTYAWNPAAITQNDLDSYTQRWAASIFGPEHANDIADLVTRYSKWNERRKPELLEPTTYSLANYGEADRVLADLDATTTEAETLAKQIPADQQAAYFELVLHPVEASATVIRMYILSGRNTLYAMQGRVSANDLADEVRALFQKDAALTTQYNHLLDGKWDHMMDQTHLGYTYWQEPPVNVMPPLTEIQPLSQPTIGVVVEGSNFRRQTPGFGMTLPTFDPFNNQTQKIDIFNSGVGSFIYSATASAPWIHINQPTGLVEKQVRIKVSVDWSRTPSGDHTESISVVMQGAEKSEPHIVHLNISNPEHAGTLHGFIESNDVVSIDADHFSASKASGGVHWEKLPGFGETLGAMEVFPVLASSTPAGQKGASLDYRMHLFNTGDRTLELVTAPTLNFVPGRGLRLAISLDDGPLQIVDTLANKSDKDWSQVVSDGVRRISLSLPSVMAGDHTLHLWSIDPALVVEKIILSYGPEKPSYLGPPESYRAGD